MISGTSAMFGESGPSNAMRTPYPTNAPTMYTSPCAKFSSFRIP